MLLDCRKPEVPDEVGKVAAEDPLSTVHVVYSESAAFGALAASMASLARHLEEPELCHIHLIVEEAKLPEAWRAAARVRRELAALPALPAVSCHELEPAPFNLSGFARSGTSYATGQNTFARFYLHKYLPAAPRALWIDTDTIIRADVARLYRTPMRHALAAVTEPTVLRDYRRAMSSAGYADLWPQLAQFVGSPYSPKMQCGVLLLDLDRWRSEPIARSLEALVKKFAGFDNDQLALNVHFEGDLDVLDWRWNVHGLGHWPFRLPPRCAREGRILHWSGPVKPYREPPAGLRLLNGALRLMNADLYSDLALPREAAEGTDPADGLP